MTFPRVRAAGLWVDGTNVPGAQWEQFDANLANALDMLDGGTYAPQLDITIGGAPGVEWSFDLPVEFNDNTTFFQPAFFDDSATFDGPVNFYYPVAFSDDVSFGDSVTFNDSATFNGGAGVYGLIEVYGNAGFYGNTTLGSGPGDVVSLQADATFSGTADFNGAVTFDSSAAYTGTVVTNGAGNLRVRRVRRQTLGTDVDTTVDVTLTDHVIVRPGVLSSFRNYTLSDTGAVNGDRVRFSCFDTLGIGVRNPGGSLMQALAPGSGAPSWCDVERIDGTWRSFPGHYNV